MRSRRVYSYLQISRHFLQPKVRMDAENMAEKYT